MELCLGLVLEHLSRHGGHHKQMGERMAMEGHDKVDCLVGGKGF